MEGIELFCGRLVRVGDVEEARGIAGEDIENYKVYPDSVHKAEASYLFIAMHKGIKVLAIFGESSFYGSFSGEEYRCAGTKVKICPLSNHNCRIIRDMFPFTNPSSHRAASFTIGLGDRLGLASAGHIRVAKNKDVFPVLAQQSIRELNLTGRNYEDVLCAACWAVFQEGYTSGFGADGDHLKTKEEVSMALDHGFTMITLDCSGYIGSRVDSMEGQEVAGRYEMIEPSRRQMLESRYLDKKFVLDQGLEIEFTADDFKRTVLIYMDAVDFAIEVYNGIIAKCERDIDFEMSIDETAASTSPQSHFLVASELIGGGVRLVSLAPRFYGEFQKGVDYRGDIDRFTVEFSKHVAIAEHFGYKLSIHSGSDKFGVFPIIAQKTQGRVHVKTAGTNWLEAMRVVAEVEPALFREIYGFAVKNLSEAKKYYHVAVEQGNAPGINGLKDSELVSLLDADDSRQILHIAYGLVLMAIKEDKTPLFRDRIYSLLNNNEQQHYETLARHIARHLAPFGR